MRFDIAPDRAVTSVRPITVGAVGIIVASLIWTAPLFAQGPEVLDRVLAAINHQHVITSSDVRRERSVMAALGEGQKDDPAILDDLIGWRLLEDQMAQFPGLTVTDEEVATALERVAGPLAAAIPDIRAAVRDRIRRAKYIDRRFGQFIRVTDEEKKQYYRDVFVPEAKKKGLDPVPGLDEPGISEAIESNVFQERLHNEVIGALDALRQMSDVEIFP
ncbi:MAG TPA: hypothetical protein VFY29_03170 [Terriglobia bacterium]|nr:hypothetical protein [Terriglobia bacterium]